MLELQDSAGERVRPDREAWVLTESVARHPDDLWVNYRLAANLYYSVPPRMEEAIRYYTAARAIRPTSAHMGNDTLRR